MTNDQVFACKLQFLARSTKRLDSVKRVIVVEATRSLWVEAPSYLDLWHFVNCIVRRGFHDLNKLVRNASLEHLLQFEFVDDYVVAL